MEAAQSIQMGYESYQSNNMTLISGEDIQFYLSEFSPHFTTFDIQEFFSNPMEAIQNFFGRIMETLQEGGIGALFNASANPQAIQAASQASLTAAARAAEALRDSEAQGADAVRAAGSTNAVTDAVRNFDGMVP